MDQSLSLTLENVLKISPDEYMMFSEDNRVKSFQDWPFDNTAACNPKTLAAAGFYHIPTNNEPDAVRCFCCFKELDGWEPEDDPWKEHSSHSSKCHFLTVRKDIFDLTMEEFIKLNSERTANKLEKFMRIRVEEFKEHSSKVREELHKLVK